MRISLMQQIDFWIGIPLCILLSIVNWVLSFFRKDGGSTPKKILFIELSEMGSAIIAHSSLLRAQKRHDSDIYFLIFRKNMESVSLLEIMPEENIITIEDENFFEFAISTIKALWHIRKLNIDTAIDLELFSRCTALITFLSGATNRVGFHRFTSEGLYRGNFLTHRVLYNPHQHMAYNFLSLVMALEVDRENEPLVKLNVTSELRPLRRIQPRPEEAEHLWNIMLAENSSLDTHVKIVFLNPDPGVLPLRGWPLENYKRLAAEILQRYSGVTLAVIGLERSRPYAEAIREYVGASRCMDLTGKTASVREVVILLTFGRLLITNDSGPAHLASLTDIKSVVLFGPETPALYGPLGSNCTNIYRGLACSPCYAASNHRRSTCRDNQCLKQITVEEVFEAADRYL
jgi:ADP-heptose:LPS heptosyltransferase